MPIYEYQCRSCGVRFEKIVSRASARVTCSACESERVDRVPSTFGIGGDGKSAAGASSGCAGCKSHSCSTCH